MGLARQSTPWGTVRSLTSQLTPAACTLPFSQASAASSRLPSHLPAAHPGSGALPPPQERRSATLGVADCRSKADVSPPRHPWAGPSTCRQCSWPLHCERGGADSTSRAARVHRRGHLPGRWSHRRSWVPRPSTGVPAGVRGAGRGPQPAGATPIGDAAAWAPAAGPVPGARNSGVTGGGRHSGGRHARLGRSARHIRCQGVLAWGDVVLHSGAAPGRAAPRHTSASRRSCSSRGRSCSCRCA